MIFRSRAAARQRITDPRVFFANSSADVQSEVLRCAEEGERIRPIGGGGARSPLSSSDENLLSLRRLRGSDRGQVERQRIWVRAGTPLRDLLGWLARHGLTLHVRPDYPEQTVGAALSVGSPWSLAQHLLGLRLVHADGHAAFYEPSSDPEVFDALRVSLGALGVVTHIELRCERRRSGRVRHRAIGFDEALRLLQQRPADLRALTWYAYAGALSETWDAQAPAANVARWSEELQGAWVEHLGTRLFSRLAAARLFDGAALANRLALRYASSELIDVLPMMDRLPAPVTYALPAAAAGPVLQRLRELWHRHGARLHAPVRLEFAPADRAWLSPAYARDSVLISTPQLPPRAATLSEELVALMCEHDGRPAWAGLRPQAPPPTVHDYPRLPEFAALRARFDRRGVFLNPFLSQLFGLPLR